MAFSVNTYRKLKIHLHQFYMSKSRSLEIWSSAFIYFSLLCALLFLHRLETIEAIHKKGEPSLLVLCTCIFFNTLHCNFASRLVTVQSHKGEICFLHFYPSIWICCKAFNVILKPFIHRNPLLWQTMRIQSCS